MLVRMRAIYASPKGACQRGKVLDLPTAEARDLIDGGYAEPIKGRLDERAVNVPAEETATVAPVESAPAKRRGRRPK